MELGLGDVGNVQVRHQSQGQVLILRGQGVEGVFDSCFSEWVKRLRGLGKSGKSEISEGLDT